MKKFFIFLTVFSLLIIPVFSSEYHYSEDYLKGKHHFSPLNPFVEKIAQGIIKKSLKKEMKGKYKIKLDGYTLGGLKKGIFKYLEITGKNILADDIRIPYFNVKTVTDYNWVDYTKNPIKFKSDIVMDFTVHFSQDSINDAILNKEYQKVIQKVNQKAYPFIMIYDVNVKIRYDKIHFIVEYNFPIMPMNKNKTVMITSGVSVKNGKLKTSDIGIDNPNGNLPVNKILNLINYIDPLSYTFELVKDKNCKAKIEQAEIKNDIIKINGKIYIKKDSEVKK